MAIEILKSSQVAALIYKDDLDNLNMGIDKNSPTYLKNSLNDGGGLRIVAKSDGRKVWIFKYTHNSIRKETTFGTYPKVTLSGARKKAKEFRDRLNNDIDPIENLRNEKIEYKKDKLKEKHTIGKIIDNFFELKQNNKKLKDITIEKARGRLKNHFYCNLTNNENTLIHDITYDKLVYCLKLLEDENKLETLFRVKLLIIEIFKYAYTEGIIEDTERFSKLELKSFKVLRKEDIKNNPALTKDDDVKKLYNSMVEYKNNIFTKFALLFSIHTAQRQGSIISAKWEDIDLKNKTWFIPAENMKMKIKHELPLSDILVNYLRQLNEISGGRIYLFPNIKGKGKHMSNNTVNNALRIIGYTNDEQTAHGLRATFKTICKKNQIQHNLPNEFVEMYLAHKTTDNVEEVYIREKNLVEMRKIANWWSEYLEGLIK